MSTGSPNPRLAFRHGGLSVNGRSVPVLAGEVQYFRTEKRHWRRMLEMLKRAHCNCLSTYVPWSWHEIEDGVFDFTGHTHPSRDLAGFLRIAEEMGFLLVLKPGPYVFAELVNGGVPGWLHRKHPEILALGPDGKPAKQLKFPHVTYLHPSYLPYAFRWLKEAYSVMRRHSARTIMWQIDNEINYSHSFFWFGPHTTDYNPFLVKNGLYQEYLKKKFGSVSRLNARYRSRFGSFSGVNPPERPSKSSGELLRTVDWVEFKEWLAVENVRRCCEFLAAQGVKEPFCVNAPFTGWATAWNNVKRWMSASDFETIIAHVDYPGIVFDQNLGETLGLIQYSRSTKSVFDCNVETQACTVSKIWGKHGTSYDLTHKTLIGSGMNMVNYYWFNDGTNFLGQGHYQESHQYDCPLDREGNPRDHYFAIRKLNSFLKAHPEIVRTCPRADVAVGYLHEWARMDLASSGTGREHQAQTNPLLNLLAACGLSFEMVDLAEFRGRAARRPMLIQTCRFMPRETIASLASFMRRGGKLVLANGLPLLDRDLKTCRDLERLTGVRAIETIPAKPGPLEPNKIRMGEDEIFVIDRVQTYLPPPGARIIATCEGKTCGYERATAKGKLTVLGFRLEFLFTWLGRRMLGKVLGMKLENPGLTLKREGKGVRLYTLVNPHDEAKLIPADGTRVRVPARRATFLLEKGRKRFFLS